MPHRITIFISVITYFLFSGQAAAQYTGGSNDGFTNMLLNKQGAADAAANKGGANDGFSVTAFNKQNFTDPLAFKGSSNDGFTAAVYNKQNYTDPFAFKGGSNDGFTVAVFNRLNSTDGAAFTGGVNDGYAYGPFNRQNFTDATIFKGGSNDGFTFAVYLKNAVLPVTLINFTGTWEDNTALLHWQTANESNTAAFSIERSSTGTDFVSAGTVTAAGNSSTAVDYEFRDRNIAVNNPVQQHFFYRLKTVDKDGKFSFSAIILLVKNPGTGFTIRLWPNPANTTVNVVLGSVPGNNNLIMVLRDAQGKTITEKKTSSNIEQLDTYSLAAGQYFISVYSNNQLLKTIPVIIQH